MSADLSITPATGSVGAYVEVDLRAVSEATADELRQAWYRYGVLFFRGQHLSADEHVEAGKIFGDPVHFNMAPPVDDSAYVHQIEVAARSRHGGVSTWHTDATWQTYPPRGSMLQAITVPQVGGDTLFASASGAYQSLSEGMRAYVDALTATHAGGDALHRASTKTGAEVPPRVHHPLVRVHPDTGERCLFVNRLFTKRIDGVPRPESDTLLPMLCDQFKDPELQCRFQWQAGDVAVWDNIAVQHYAAPDYDDERLMHRVVLAGANRGA